MKKLLFVLVLTVMVNLAHAQSNWSQGNFYQYRGQIFNELCSNLYPKYNGYGQYVGTFQCIRTSVWHQEWRQGYIYLWNPSTGQWYTEWKQGSFWYFTWQNQEKWLGY